MDYNNLVRDFAQRTRHNLDRIRQLENQNEPVFAITQLINSLLGLLVFPRQEFLNRIPATPVNELEADGCPVAVVAPGFETPPRIYGNSPGISATPWRISALNRSRTEMEK